jgi:hypothetical protein
LETLVIVICFLFIKSPNDCVNLDTVNSWYSVVKRQCIVICVHRKVSLVCDTALCGAHLTRVRSTFTQHLVPFHLFAASWQGVLLYKKYKHFLKSRLTDFSHNCIQFHCLFCKLPAKSVCFSYGTSLNSVTAFQTEPHIFIPPTRFCIDQSVNHLDNFCETIKKSAGHSLKPLCFISMILVSLSRPIVAFDGTSLWCGVLSNHRNPASHLIIVLTCSKWTSVPVSCSRS